MIEYALTSDPNVVLRRRDGRRILLDVDDPDRAAYLEWLAAGNTPDPPQPPADPFDPAWSWGATFADIVGGQKTGGSHVG
jgi:hypothetical protein